MAALGKWRDQENQRLLALKREEEERLAREQREKEEAEKKKDDIWAKLKKNVLPATPMPAAVPMLVQKVLPKPRPCILRVTNFTRKANLTRPSPNMTKRCRARPTIPNTTTTSALPGQTKVLPVILQPSIAP